MEKDEAARYLGIATDDYHHYDTVGQRVELIAWDSPAIGLLEVGDIIMRMSTAGQDVSGKTIPRFSYPHVNEHEIWTTLKSPGGEPVSLTLLRDGKMLAIDIEPSIERLYGNDKGQRSLFPDGPYYLANDGFRESWSGWYERIVKAWSRILADGWRATNFNSRHLLREHQSERARIDFLLEKHSGAFADAMSAQWEQVNRNLQGRSWKPSDIDSSYREFEEQRVAAFQAASREAHDRFRAQLGDALQPAFPAPDPYHPDANATIGRIVCIEGVSPRDMRGSGPQAWYIMGDRYGGWYFLDANAIEVKRLGDCLLTYMNQVSPSVPERYTFYLEILDEPMMRPRERRQVVRGFRTRLIAAEVGDALFVEALDTDSPLMPGAETLRNTKVAMPEDAWNPEDVVKARIDAVKWSRRDVWSALLADWTVSHDWLGEPLFVPCFIGRADSQSHWEHSRKRLFDDVVDIHVIGSSKAHTILAADPGRGIPHVEEAEVCVEHVGSFDGEYHSFKDSWLTRYWRVQRLNGGPWRVVFPGAI